MTDRPARILVVDDVPDNRDLLSRRLARQGHAVLEAEDGRKALDVLSETSIDLVLLDIMMPNLNGYEVLERMKADENLRRIPVLMITAVDELESTVKCIQLGAEDYLTKPFNSVLLKARVEACLDKKRLRDQEVEHLRRIEEEKQRADHLLNVLLPSPIAEELKSSSTVRPRRHEDVAVLFCDIVGFTEYCDRHEPEEVVDHLQCLVKNLEAITARHGLLKIKTVGDAFMAASNLLVRAENAVRASVECGKEMLSAIEAAPPYWQARVGVHYGPVVAGVVGGERFAYDVWGDTVNTAARVESYGSPGCVNLSREAWDRLNGGVSGESLGLIPVKGKGEIEIFRLHL